MKKYEELKALRLKQPRREKFPAGHLRKGDCYEKTALTGFEPFGESVNPSWETVSRAAAEGLRCGRCACL